MGDITVILITVGLNRSKPNDNAPLLLAELTTCVVVVLLAFRARVIRQQANRARDHQTARPRAQPVFTGMATPASGFTLAYADMADDRLARWARERTADPGAGGGGVLPAHNPWEGSATATWLERALDSASPCTVAIAVLVTVVAAIRGKLDSCSEVTHGHLPRRIPAPAPSTIRTVLVNQRSLGTDGVEFTLNETAGGHLSGFDPAKVLERWAYGVAMPGWPDLSSLEILVAVADHGSLSAAGRTVGMAQPNASRAVARLERRLGVPLLQRSTHGSALTPAGIVAAEWSREVLTAARRLVDGSAALSHDGPPPLTVSASQTVAEHLLPVWLTLLRAAHPQLRVTLAVHNSTQVIADVLAGACDVGFVEGITPPPSVHHRVVARDQLILVVPIGHPWSRRRSPVAKAELANTPLVVRERGSGTRMALDAALGQPAHAALELPSNAAVRVSVQAGAGPAVLSRLAVQPTDTVREVATELDLSRNLYVVWTGPRRMQGVAAELVQHVLRSTLPFRRP